jgi:uncharacterized membrane protein YccC
MNTLWKSFLKFTSIVFVILAIGFAVAWFFAPREHFIRISCILYGFLLGWLAAWWNRWWYSQKPLNQ